MRDHTLLLKCAEPECAAAQLIVVQRSALAERLAAIRSVGWEPCTDTYVHVWCPNHRETRGVPA